MTGDNLIEKLSRDDAKSLLENNNLNVSNNYELLENAIRESDISVLNCENPQIKLQRISSKIVFVAPDFLQNPKEKKHSQQNKEIKLNIDSFSNICKQINDYVDKAYEALNSLKQPSLDINEEIKNILTEFTNTVKNLCTPLINEQIGLDSINKDELTEENKIQLENDKQTISGSIRDFILEAGRLLTNYFNQFKPICGDIKYICESIETIPKPIDILQEKIEEYKYTIEELLDKINDENDNIHEKLLTIKDLFILIKEQKKSIIKEMEENINNLQQKYDSRRDVINPLKEEIEQNIISLRNKSKIIGDDIKNLREKYEQEKIEIQEINIAPIETEKINNNINKILTPIKEETKIMAEKIKDPKNEHIEDRIIKQTSLDLLYLMDITGSMQDYVDNTKKELLNVMKKIIESFSGIDINLGFIGYKDLEEHSKNDFIDINFTKNHEEIKNKILEVQIGGGGDTAEDIAFGFERALNKDWNSYSKFIILTTDAPCHGLKYHEPDEYDDHPNGIPGRKDIEESIKSLCDQNICLFCIKLNPKTDIMFNIFRDIYVKNNKENYFFMDSIENAENLHKVILEKCKDVYEKNRFINN